jgi:glycerol-3-phosphate acyltransferase PlsY
VYSLFLGFRGGKGVATALGAVAGVDPTIGGVLLLVWVITAVVWRYSSGAALAAFAGLPLCALLLERSGMFQVFSLVVAAIIFLRHQDNVRRLWQGTEPRIGR